MLAGFPFSFQLDFSAGLPTGAVTYSVLGNTNAPLGGFSNLTVTPPLGALSLLIVVPGTANTCALPLFENRTVVWSYLSNHGIVQGSERYRVEKPLPFVVSADGVRAKLGIEDHELADRDIDLVLAYAKLASKYDDGVLDSYATGGDLRSLLVINAIEALAALDVLPSLQLAVAKAEDSGTNKYQRFTSIDWDALAAGLAQHVMAVDEIVGVSDDDVAGITLMYKAGRTNDPFTGSEYATTS